MAFGGFLGAMSGAAGVATNLFSYFSPVKSPYYTVIVVSSMCLVLAKSIGAPNFYFIFIPITLVLLISTVLSILSAPNFTAADYNAQIIFARSSGISSAIGCLVALGLNFTPNKQSDLIIDWQFWVTYICGIAQILTFLFYIFIYHNFEEKAQGRNFVQICLVASTYLIAATYMATQLKAAGTNGQLILATFYLLWACNWMFLVAYAARHVQLIRPRNT